MIQIPQHLLHAYTSFLTQKCENAKLHRHYIKWLRYYFDFCQKYSFELSEKESLSAFINKLTEKKQPEPLRNQARKAICFFYEMKGALDKENRESASVISASSTIPKAPRPDYSDTKIYQFGQGDPSSSSLSEPENTHNLKEPTSPTSLPPKQSGADWSEVFDELKNAIKLRHLSPKTLQTYS